MKGASAPFLFTSIKNILKWSAFKGKGNMNRALVLAFVAGLTAPIRFVLKKIRLGVNKIMN